MAGFQTVEDTPGPAGADAGAAGAAGIDASVQDASSADTWVDLLVEVVVGLLAEVEETQRLVDSVEVPWNLV